MGGREVVESKSRLGSHRRESALQRFRHVLVEAPRNRLLEGDGDGTPEKVCEAVHASSFRLRVGSFIRICRREALREGLVASSVSRRPKEEAAEMA